jgi:hypothetical protein
LKGLIENVAIIKQQIESMCTFEALLEKCKTLQAGNHLQQDVDFLVQNAVKLTYEHL